MKNLPFIVALVWFLQLVPCQGQESSQQMPRAVLTSGQVDTFRKFSGQEVPKSLWDVVFADSLLSQPVHFLAGNLDEDPTDEITLWFSMDLTGWAICFDKRGAFWEKTGAVQLNFFHGNKPPRIDSKARMLLCYSYGWGSGYGSEILHFYQSRNDSLVCVFHLLEYEYSSVSGCDASRIIYARYDRIDAENILITYYYRVIAGEDSRHKGRIVFEKKIDVPCFWDYSENIFVPKFPEGLSEYTYKGDILDGQYSFDYFFSPALHEIKWNGPRWKRRALGNPYEN